MKSVPARRKITRKALMALLQLTLLLAPIGETICGELSSSLQRFVASPENRQMRVLVFLDDKDVLSKSQSSNLGNLNRSQLHQLYYQNLRENSQNSVSKFDLAVANSSLPMRVIKSYWITNAALVEINAADLEKLAGLEGVALVVPDTTLVLVEPTFNCSAPQISSGAENNLRVIKADKLWARGLTGRGRLIASFDTGVDGAHPALASHWRGLISGNISAAWFDPYGSSFPTDQVSHGTHVMGIMAGRDGADTIGVAFNAEWISAAVIDRGSGLSRTISDILDAFEWVADPDENPNTMADVPDVVCHSWGIPAGIFPACDNTFWTALDNLENLGIVSVFAAGNEGPDSMSLRYPADRSSTPLNAFSVGAIDQRDPNYVIAEFSSRGPSHCDNAQIKPEVVAPGMMIRSAIPNSSYGYKSGTSMAAPQVAAAVALLREYNPEATSVQVKQALYASATDLGPAGEDNTYGKGLINLELALSLMPPPSSPQIDITDYQALDSNNDIIVPGEEFALVVDIVNRHAPVNSLWARLTVPDEYAHLIRDSVNFGSISADGSANNLAAPFKLRLADQVIPGGMIPLDLNFYNMSGGFLGTERITLIACQSKNARLITLSNDKLQLTVDNFGGLGHGPRSLSAIGGTGFVPISHDFDILPEFSLMISPFNDTIVMDAARGKTKYISDNDFMASRMDSAILVCPGTFGSTDLYGYYNDSLAPHPMGFSVRQRTSLFDRTDLENCVMIEYAIRSETQAALDSFYIGFLMDWDLNSVGSGIEKCGYNSYGQFAYFYNQSNDLYVGVRFLSQPLCSGQFLPNGPDSKALIGDAEKHAYMASGEVMGGVEKWGDYYSIISTRTAGFLSPDSVKVALAMAVGASLEELQASLTQAYDYYNIVTSVDDGIGGDAVLPTVCTLDQNYPNPFNMETQISFTLPAKGDVQLDVYNIIGQKVAVLANGEYPSGTSSIRWNGKDKAGNDLATGLYLYRLTYNGTPTAARKLMILK